MGFDVDQEILEDFLVEAGEILEQLSEQLVDLEQRPDDSELLNAIFRGFHTVKGGAGFLQLDPMVECCHKAENLFDQLRNGALKVTPELMDLVLQALDAVNTMFASVRDGREPTPAAPELLQRLVDYAEGRGGAAAEPEPRMGLSQAESPLLDNPNTPSDDFEALLDDLVDVQQTAAHGPRRWRGNRRSRG